MIRSAVFLDRDGVLNEPVVRGGRPYSPMVARDFRLIADSIRACELLHDAGLALVVVTNQPEISRGSLSTEELTAMHDELARTLPLDEIRVCPHDDRDKCECRKPRPGMIIESASTLTLDLPRSVVVGDRWRDIEAGHQAGCSTVFIDRNWDERSPERYDARFGSLLEATTWIINSAKQ